MNIIKKSIAALAILSITSSFAQEVPKTTFSGNADFYYRFDFANAGNIGVTNNLTSFTNSHDSFELGMASIKATHKEGKASVVADLGFGTRAKEFTYNDNDTQFMIKQLNMTYEFTDKFKVTAGAFTTHLGYELLDATDNKNYSMSYAFTNGPFFNTGVKAQYTSGKFSIMAGVTNPTDFKTAVQAGSNQKTIIGQLGYAGETGSAYLNFTTGSNNPSTFNNQQIDLVVTKKIGEKLTLGFNGTFATVSNDPPPPVSDVSWFSAIGYIQVVTSKATSLAYRIEYFGNNDGAKYANPLAPAAPVYPAILDPKFNVISNTLSLNFKEGRFTFIPEVRFDIASKNIFSTSKDLDPLDPKFAFNPFVLSKSAASILFATTYSF